MKTTMMFLSLSSTGAVWAGELNLGQPFTDHMVLQRYLPVPGKVTATPESSTRALVGWELEGTCLEGFEIQRQDAGSSPDWKVLRQVGPEERSARDTRLSPGGQYQYRVKAGRNKLELGIREPELQVDRFIPANEPRCPTRNDAGPAPTVSKVGGL